MLVYRIVHKLYSKNLIASGAGGRWNSSGNKVVYAAESIALAFLENMIRRQGIGFNLDFKIMIIDIPATASITEIKENALESGWRNFNDYSKCDVLGDQWYNESKALILKIPSAVLPGSFNFVMNTLHPDFDKIKLAGVTDLVPDERIEEILKNYESKK